MTRRNQLFLAVAAVLMVAVIGARRYFGDEAAIRRMFAALSRDVAAEKLLATATHISRRYGDPRGGTYETLLGGAADIFQSNADIDLAITLSHVSLSGATAAVELKFRITGAPASGGGRADIIGTLLDPARARVMVRKSSGNWQIERVEELEGIGR